MAGLTGGLVGLDGREQQQAEEDWSFEANPGAGPSAQVAEFGTGNPQRQSTLDLQGTLNSLLNAGDGWYGPGVAAPLGEAQYTPGLGIAGAGQQAPVQAWNYRLGGRPREAGAGGGINPFMPARGLEAGGFQFGAMPGDYQFGSAAIKNPSPDSQEYADYLKALQAIYESDPRIAEQYNAMWGEEGGQYDIGKLNEALQKLDTDFWSANYEPVSGAIRTWVDQSLGRLDEATRASITQSIWEQLNMYQNKVGGGKTTPPPNDYVRAALKALGPKVMQQAVSGNDWQTRMEDWLTNQGENPYFGGKAPDQAAIKRYAADMEYWTPTPQQTAQMTPVTPGGVWIRPRAIGNPQEILNKYGLQAQGAMQSGGWYWVPVKEGSEWSMANILSREGAVGYATPNLMPTGEDDFGSLTPTQRAFQSWLYLHPDEGAWDDEDLTTPAPQGGTPQLNMRVPRGGW